MTPEGSTVAAQPAVARGRFQRTASTSRTASPARATASSETGNSAQSTERDSADDEGFSFLTVMTRYSAPQPGDPASSGREKRDKNSSPKQDDSVEGRLLATPAYRIEQRPDILPLALALPQKLDMADPEGGSSTSLFSVADATADGGTPDAAGPKERKPARSVESLTPPDPPEDLETSPPSAPHGEIAFAARLSSAETESAAAPVKPAHLAQRQAAESAGNGNEPETATETSKGGPSPVVERLANADGMPSPLPAGQSQPAAPARPEAHSISVQPMAHLESSAPEPTPTPASSSHDITIRIPDATERGTDVRFVERGGEVHVSVRTSDAQMAQTLRGGLSDFVSRLDQSGIRAEVWQPGSDASSSQKDAQNQSPDQRADQQGSGSGRHQSESEEPAGDQRGAKRPRWVEEMEESLGQKTSQPKQ
jgi:hypothetical protein